MHAQEAPGPPDKACGRAQPPLDPGGSRRGELSERLAHLLSSGMATWIALLRGINVGGKNLLPMAKLRATLTALGFEDVATYVQSGNAVFRSSARSAAKLQQQISAALEGEFDLAVPVLVLAAKEVKAALAANPFPEASEPKFVHLSFLFTKPKRPDLVALAKVATATEEFRLEGRVFTLHAPDGIGRSKLAAQVERKLGVEGTARNLRTVTKLVEMAGE